MIETIKKIEVVQAYIYHRKNKEIKINPPQTDKDYMLLEKAYRIAVDWFMKNNGSISFSLKSF